MNLLAHSIAQGPVNPLVTSDATGTIKLPGNDGGEEMPAVTLDRQMLAVEPLGNEVLNV